METKRISKEVEVFNKKKNIFLEEFEREYKKKSRKNNTEVVYIFKTCTRSTAKEVFFNNIKKKLMREPFFIS